MKVEVGQYKAINKGSLKASFSLVIYPEGQKILDCKLFDMNGRSWFAFPTKEIKYTDGRKTDYIPLISYGNKTYLEELKSAVMEALKQQDQNAETKNYTKASNADQIQDEPLPLW